VLVSSYLAHPCPWRISVDITKKQQGVTFPAKGVYEQVSSASYNIVAVFHGFASNT